MRDKAATDYFSQEAHRVRLDWGWRGCRAAAARGDAIVVVDVLRFSTAVIAACAGGAVVVPSAMVDDQEPSNARWKALSPATYQDVQPESRVTIASLNGGTCVRLASGGPRVLIGALVNARAVGQAINRVLSRDSNHRLTVIACGERWADDSEDGRLRFAIEDYLGAGAILSHVSESSKSPEARLCQHAFCASINEFRELIRASGSGRELIGRDSADDLEHALAMDRYDVVPVLRDECLRPLDHIEE